LLGKALTLGKQAAIKAGEFLKKGLYAVRDISSKTSCIDLVTEMDRRAERLLVRSLLSSFPGHDILAEESSYPSKGSEYCWYIDPLDGTTNYVHGFPVFSVSIALVSRKVGILVGVVYNPNLEEIFYATCTGGAYRNGRRIRVSTTTRLSNALLATGFPYDLRHTRENNLNYFNAFVYKARAIRRAGSAALDLCYTACGIFDGFWEIKLSPWDMAAGVLIATQAGAKVTNLAGKRLDLHEGDIVASNGLIHRQMLRVISSVRGRQVLLR
jgi:myo-inositol-1(or 4)-monophosphatase